MRRIALVSLIAAAGCAQDVTAPDIFNLDRPSAVTFGCVGDLRITNGQPASPDQEVITSAMPVDACRIYNSGEAPEGQGPIDGALNPTSRSFVSFVLQPTKGSVAVVEQAVDQLNLGGVIDADPYTPGRNAIPIGTLPVDLDTSVDGCYMLAPNAGSCDLSVLDVRSAIDRDDPAIVNRLQLTAGGAPLRARPADIASPPQTTDIGFVCPDAPTGVTYIAYPDCNWVAAIDPSTGEAVAGIRFGDGTVEITDGAVTCADECGAGGVAALGGEFGGPGRPVALQISGETNRLYIGAENLNAITIVDLDENQLPATVSQIALDGEVGVLQLDESPLISMGGTTGIFGAGSGGNLRFVYAVATDATVRVVEVGNRRVECDTQVDVRYLHDVRDVSFLACMPVGDVATPPRRSGARSPGIHIPRVRSLDVQDWDGIPLDVTFAAIDASEVDCSQVDGMSWCPTRMIGYFAFITAADGVVYVVTVDDDQYPDFELSETPIEASMRLAIAHQLRDAAVGRGDVDDPPTCTTPGDSVVERGPRLAGTVATLFDTGVIANNKGFRQPTMAADLCLPSADTAPEDGQPAPELAFYADPDTRESAFLDLYGIRNETVRLSWEGRLSQDGTNVSIDGPAVRRGTADIGGGSFGFEDAVGPFCRMGAQPHDILVLAGCDPTRGDADCGIGETCFVHPDLPELLFGTGVCIDESEQLQLAERCADYMTSRRRYSITSVERGRIELAPRRRVLDSTPIDGCADVAQCDELYRTEVDDASFLHPIEIRNATCDEDQGIACPNGYACQGTTCVLENQRSFVCEEDPSRKPGKSWCVMTCESRDDCLEGDVCLDGYCAEAPLPPADCVASLQRYYIRVGEAFAMLGDLTGFQHNIVADESGVCVESATPDPLQVGRIPLSAPDCTGDGFTDVTPNPCQTTVDHWELLPAYEVDGDTCGPETPELQAVELADSRAIRVTTEGYRFHITNLENTGNADCIADRQGTYPLAPTPRAGTQIRFELTGGFVPLLIAPPFAPTIVFPGTIAPSPDGTLWVLDQGDRSSATQGQIMRLNPNRPQDGFAATLVSTGQ